MYFSTKFTTTPLAPSMSPRPVVITCLIGVSASTCWTVSPKLSTTTSTAAPESTSWCLSSRAVYSGLTLTTVRPARSTPKVATGYCRQLGIIRATRSPFLSFSSPSR
ncbi:hypothetical protein D3C71_1513060 [compost metagenome]